MFIQEIKEGDTARYHPIKGEPHDGKVYKVQKIGTLGHGQAVAWLVGKSGCVALTHLGPVEYCGCDHDGLDQGRISAILGSEATCRKCGKAIRRV